MNREEEERKRFRVEKNLDISGFWKEFFSKLCLSYSLLNEIMLLTYTSYQRQVESITGVDSVNRFHSVSHSLILTININNIL